MLNSEECLSLLRQHVAREKAQGKTSTKETLLARLDQMGYAKEDRAELVQKALS